MVGGGGREHALVWALAREPGVSLICAPGNPGIARLARTVPLDLSRPLDILGLAEQERVDLTIVGPELPLSLGVVDVFRAAGMPIFGPTKSAAALESSKAFAKQFMARHGVPTAGFRACTSYDDAVAVVDSGEFGFPVVIKADGLAAGKGVVIAGDRDEALTVLADIMVHHRFGRSGDTVVLEEFLSGDEASYFVVAAGESAIQLTSAQDHKRAFDDDRGPNTGGMGAFAPSSRVTPAVERRVLEEVIRPVLTGMAAEGAPFTGFLYAGLMLTPAGPRVIEFNVRFGDPEAQVILPMLAEPLAPMIASAAAGSLQSRSATFMHERHVGVVLASRGYPESSDAGTPIRGLDVAEALPDTLVFHSGTAMRDGQVVTNGGRVLTVVGRGSTYAEAITTVYRAVEALDFDGVHYRRDIGRKAEVGGG